MIFAENCKLVESSDKCLYLPKQEGDLTLRDDDIWMIVGPHHLMKSLPEFHIDLTQKAIGRAYAMQLSYDFSSLVMLPFFDLPSAVFDSISDLIDT